MFIFYQPLPLVTSRRILHSLTDDFGKFDSCGECYIIKFYTL